MGQFIRNREFPHNLWADTGVWPPSAVLAEVEGTLNDCRYHYGAARDIAALAVFVREVLPNGVYYIFGAGSHTRILLEMLSVRPGIVVKGIVDRLAAAVGEAFGLPVVPVSDLPGNSFDYVLLSHTAYEREMAEALVDAGIPCDRILPIYTHAGYIPHASAASRRIAVDLAGRHADAVIVTSAGSQILSDNELTRVLDPARTVQLSMMRSVDYSKSSIFETIDLLESLDLLRQAIHILSPKLIYLRGLIYKTYIGSFLLHHFPEVTLVHEPYDYAVLWPDYDLQALFGLTPTTIRLTRLWEFHTANFAALTLSKRGGEDWKRLQGHCRGEFRTYFPMIEKAVPPSAWTPHAPGDPMRLLYAGFLPSSRFLTAFRNAHNFLPIAEAVCEENATLDIFNSTHAGKDNDFGFQDYMNRYAEGPIRYHRRVPSNDMLSLMAQYDFGWLADKQYEFQPDRYVAICNRWSGYVAGGLPVLLDAGWTYMSEMVKEFGAGIVLDDMDPRQIAERLKSADLQGLRHGTAALRQHCLDWNHASLDLFGAVAERAGVHPSVG